MSRVMAQLTIAERRELATALRRLLDAVERGELEADTPQARRLVAYLEGGSMALRAVEGELDSPVPPDEADPRAADPAVRSRSGDGRRWR